MELIWMVVFLGVSYLSLIGYFQHLVWMGKAGSVDQVVSDLKKALFARDTNKALPSYCYPLPLIHEEAKDLDLGMLGEAVYVSGLVGGSNNSIQCLRYKCIPKNKDKEALQEVVDLFEHSIHSQIWELRNWNPDYPLFTFVKINRNYVDIYIALSDEGQKLLEAEKEKRHTRKVNALKDTGDLEE